MSHILLGARGFAARSAAVGIVASLAAVAILSSCQREVTTGRPNDTLPTAIANAPHTSVSETQREFQRLYKQYAARYQERVFAQATTIAPMQATIEAARIWEEVFGERKALVAARACEMFDELDDAAPIREEEYNEVAAGVRVAGAEPGKAWKTTVAGEASRTDPVPDEAKDAPPLKQFRWNPTSDAQMALNNWRNRSRIYGQQ